METIRELREEHRLLEADARRLLAIVGNRVPDAASVAAMRWDMAQQLFNHCEREDRGVYERMAVSGDARAIATARAYRLDHGAMSAAFGRYISDWPVARIASEWTVFRAETEAMVARIEQRLRSEEAELYPAVEHVIARRAA